MELSKAITGYEDYLVTDQGNVYSLKRGAPKRLKLYQRSDGYVEVGLWRDGVGINHLVHRLVLSEFVGPCPADMQACHGDGDKLNNKLDNLRWDTPKANYQDQMKHGTAHPVISTECREAAIANRTGSKHTDETKEMISQSKLGVKQSAESIQKRKAYWTPERRAKRAEQMKAIWAKRNKE